MPASKILDSIHDAQDSILKEVLGCGKCGKAFRLIKAELELLRKWQFPIPRLCPDCRHSERNTQMNLPKIWDRRCQCLGIESGNGSYRNQTKHFHGDQSCSNEFQTSYAPDRPEVVYCEQCYQAEVA